MKRLGLIGVGPWGRRYVDRIGEREDCRISMVARASMVQAHTVPGATPCESWQTLLRRAAAGELDGVIAATAPLHQAEVAAACAALGVPLLVEKPLGLSLADVASVRERFDASERKAPLVVDYIHLWSAAFVRLKARVGEAGGAGSVLRITTQGFNRGPIRVYSSLHDYAPHDLTMALDLLGTDAEFRLHDVGRTTTGPGYELYDARFDLGGVPVHMRVGNGADHKARGFTVTLRDGRTLAYDDTRPHPYKLVENDTPLAVDAGGPLDGVLTDFLKQIGEWQRTGSDGGRARGALGLSARVNAIVDKLAARAVIETA